MVYRGEGQANNEFLISDDLSKPSTHFLYLDANKWYGPSMMQLLSVVMLDWAIPEKNKLDNYRNDSPIGFFLEIDHDYPYKLHDLHNHCIFAREK